MTLWLPALVLAMATVLLLFRALRQMLRYQTLSPLSPPPDAAAVNVIIPARNEERAIARCLAGMFHQDYPAAQTRIIVVDDGSSDQTAAIVRKLIPRHPNVQLLSAPPLPPGWVGKSHACWLGAQAAQPAPWICFLDADTIPQPPLLSSAIALATRLRLDMLSLEPFQELGSFWERLVLPAGFLLLAVSQDIAAVNDPANPHATANGQFLLLRSDAYRTIGGHAAVRHEVCEDAALARSIKVRGLALRLLGGEQLIRARMYHGWRELWHGLGRTATMAIGGTWTLALFAAAAMFLAAAAVTLPASSLALLSLSPPHMRAAPLAAAILACSASATLLGMHLGLAWHFCLPLWYGLLFPLAYLSGAAVAFHSVFCHLRGRVTWKARTYAPRPPRPTSPRSPDTSADR